MKKQHPSIRFPIRRKLFLFLLFTIIIPLVLFGSFLFATQINALEEEISTAAQRELVQMAERMNLEFVQVRAVSNLLYLDEDICLLLAQAGGAPQATAAQDATQEAFRRRIAHYNTGLNNMVFKVAFIDSGGHTWGNARPNAALVKELQSSAWMQKLEQRPFDLLWMQNTQLDALFSSPEYPYIYLVRQMHDRKTWKPLGTLILGIPELEMRKMYYGYVGWDQSCYLIDRDGKLVSEVDNLSLGMPRETVLEDASSFSGTFTTGSGPGRLLVNHYTISSTQWKIVTMTDLQSRFSGFSDIIVLYFIILLLYLAISLVLSGIMASWFSRPITNIYTSILRVRDGDLAVQVPVTTKDEVGEVATQFNNMLEEIRDLLDRIVLEQKAKRDAEILSLQTQINPHFLYNTLASIRYLIYAGNKQTADTAILSLIRLMKNTLSDTNEFVTVESEISLLNDYITLQQLAFTRPVEVKIDVADEVRSCKIIKLLLQPVVENAFLHGLKPQKGPLHLLIRGSIRGSEVVFEIRDSGVGFDADATGFTSTDPTKRSIGLCNVHNRVSLTFGERYGVAVESKPGSGTAVTLTMPVINSEGDYSSYEHFSGG